MVSAAEAGVNSEGALLAQARSGDLNAFSGLVRLYESRAVRVAYSFLGNFEDARDIAQEAFVRAFENLKKFKAESKFSTWLYRIVVNLCKDALRKKKIRKFIPLPSEEKTETEDPVEKIPARSPGPLGGVLNQELGCAIQEGIDKLPVQQKSVFTLRYLEGLSLGEISGLLDLSVGAVKAHLWQATSKMKKNLTDFSPSLKSLGGGSEGGGL